MHTLLHKALTGLCLMGLLTACDTEDDPTGGGEGGAGANSGEIDAGAGGEGGQGGAGGGQGGEGGGQGGEGGEGGGDPDGPCAQLDEAQCGDRDDCAAQTDVFDAFSRCSDAATAACRFLSEDQCGGRDDCAWDADEGVCGAPELTCADHDDAATCAGADCYWYADGCHAEPQPAQCDQPDQGACEAANCQWTADGCIPLCETFAEPACNARPECEWTPEGCAPAPEMMDCADLDPENCVARADCTWFDDACIDRPDGDCAGLDEMACTQRPDCEPLYNNDERVPPPPEGGGDELPMPGYAGCQERIFDCGEVPIDACDRTPGCQIVEEEDAIVCAPADPDGCAELDANRCEAHPRCRPEFEAICDEGDRPGGDGDFDPLPQPCREEFRCVPDVQQAPCEAVPVDACWERRDCQVVEDPECGGGMLPPPPPPPDGADPAPAPECLRCAPRDVEPGECQDLDQNACTNREDCQWRFNEADPVEGVPAPPEGGFCEPVPVRNCQDLNQATCIDRDGCRWVEQGGGPVPLPCECPEGEPNCACPELIPPPPMGGFCEPDAPRGCRDYNDARQCQAQGCEWVGGGEICECFVSPDGEEICECRDGGGFCQDPQMRDECLELPEEECAGMPQCEWVEGQDVQCDCPEGEECACPPVAPGFCQRAQPQNCAGLDPVQCNAAPNCRVEEIFPPCAQPCDPDEPDCEPVECEPVQVCVDDAPVGPCGGAQDPMTCDQNGCEWIEQGGGCECRIDENGQEVCACEGGGGFCQPRQQQNRCAGFDEAACNDAPHCWAIDCAIACQGDPECEAECREDEGLCVDGALICPEAPIEICGQIDACRVEEFEICGGGCDMDGNCEDVCQVERRCVGNDGGNDGGEMPEPMPLPEPVEPVQP